MPLLWLSIAFLLGILLAVNLPLTPLAWLILAFLCLFSLIFTRFFFPRLTSFHSIFRLTPSASRLTLYASRFTHHVPRLPLPLSVLFLFLFLGSARYASVQPRFAPGFIAWYNAGEGEPEREMVVEGILAEPPDVRDSAILLTVQANRLHSPDSKEFIPVHGLLLARAQPGGDWHYGDRVSVEGILQTPPEEEEFSYRDYLARQGVYSYITRPRVSLLARNEGNPIFAAIYAFRDRTLATIYEIYPDPEASLLAGILLGIDNNIPASVLEAFQETGTAHIIAISGFNISILAGLFSSLFGRIFGARRRFLALGLSAASIALYTLLVGASASVMRAALMGGLSLFARTIGRRQDGLNSLALVAALMALANPLVLWDAGFQLSFTATLGLILYADPLSKAFIQLASRRLPPETARRLAGPVGEYFLFTLAAQLLSLPVTMFHFQRFSLTAWIANPAVLPAQPPVMVLGGLAVVLGMLFLPLGRLAGYLAWPFVAYTIRAVELFARIPGGSLAMGSFSLPAVLLFYALLLGWTFAAPRLKKVGAALSPSLALLALGSLVVVVWRSAFSAPDGRLHLVIMDVGTGDGVLIQTPAGRSLLVDGGPSPSQLSDALGRRLPLANRKLDFLIVAAGNEEQVGAMPRVLERFPPQSVLWAGPTQGTYASRQLLDALNGARIPVTEAHTGHVLDLGQGALLKVLCAGKRGGVLLLEWRRFRLLLPVGADFEDFQELENGQAVGPVTALLLSESGYAPANPPEWIAALNPQLVLLSVGAADRRGLPSPETLEAVQGYPLLRTDRNGWIHITTDGEKMWVEVERR